MTGVVWARDDSSQDLGRWPLGREKGSKSYLGDVEVKEEEALKGVVSFGIRLQLRPFL